MSLHQEENIYYNVKGEYQKAPINYFSYVDTSHIQKKKNKGILSIQIYPTAIVRLERIYLSLHLYLAFCSKRMI